MKPEQIVLAERVIWLLAFAAMTVAVGAFDWRAGLFFAGLMLWLSSIDIPRRQA
jgi:hypothetical protein